MVGPFYYFFLENFLSKFFSVQPIEHFRFDVIEETVPKSSTSRFEGALTSADLGEDMDYVDVDSLSRSHDDHLKLFFANVHTQTIPLDEECDITATLIIEEDHNSSDKPTAPISLNIMAVSSEETSAANDATIATDSGVGADLTPKEGMKEKVSRKVSKTRSKTEEVSLLDIIVVFEIKRNLLFSFYN